MFKKVRIFDWWVENQKKWSASTFETFLEEIIKPDIIFSKFYEFAFVPEIESNFQQFPVEIKLRQLNSLSKRDWEHLDFMRFSTKGDYEDCFEFFWKRTEVIMNLAVEPYNI